MILTKKAFDFFRQAIGEPRLPPEGLIANIDQVKQMQPSDGLLQWIDGVPPVERPPTPLLDLQQVQAAHLWVVRAEDVVHAGERCEFGDSLESGVIKHTNLTGGAAAYSGGELVFLSDGTIVVNGCSGRYGPRSKAELDSVARAFAQSGYGVWSMGFDEETNRPARFVGAFPEWVE
ncbi:hypothetical protein J2X20_003330 [Pelomonas saccharophila]|uniref:Uncharacterized protein n=1 Tax=Roseateles saccharophilus TaxID=304 RepID=A0ABU1YP84_ROSSA|nr:hypothetical protein [Roseateles saccharophilus]MDR7270672.1 hypothetical protein [Roseateles saccharophilus]